jgi:ABC-2 type transport system permease protein
VSALLRGVRVLWVGWLMQLKLLAVSAFDGILNIIYPLFFATCALLMFTQSGDAQTLVYAGLGAAVMGTWSSMATSASAALQGQRWQGTLELLVTAPTRVALAVLPITAGLSTVALYSMVATLLWGRVLFGIEVPITSPVTFGVALLVTLGSLATFGFLLSVTVVRYRTGWALGSTLEYPGWLLCGFLVPLDLFPEWVRWIARALPPTWGMEAIRTAAAGGDAWPAIGLCALLGLVYAALGVWLSERLIDSARRNATLALT